MRSKAVILAELTYRRRTDDSWTTLAHGVRRRVVVPGIPAGLVRKFWPVDLMRPVICGTTPLREDLHDAHVITIASRRLAQVSSSLAATQYSIRIACGGRRRLYDSY